ncbi:hypothetical protein EY06_15380, partial [Staphylococcus aureus]
FQMAAMETCHGHDVTAPDDGLVATGHDVALPCVHERGVAQHRVVALKDKHIVGKVIGRSHLCRNSHQI